jgi:YidC/Oxa1 family membrane protein insertase
MNIFELLIVQPIFNILVVIYGLLPGIDFGITIILFTIIVRLILWPLIKKQLHHTKVMRKLQPELSKIKARAKGNKQLESQLMMELYRERGVNPFGSIGVLFLQLPILIALYQVIQLITTDKHNIERFTYGFLKSLPRISDIIHNPSHFSETLFGFVNLTKHTIDQGAVYWPLLVLAVFAAAFQYIQSKQLAPTVEKKKRLRDVLKEQAAGKQIDQSEVTALVTNNTLFLFPAITFMICLYLPGALVLYYMVSSLVAVIQQKLVLDRDEEELETIAESPAKKQQTKAKKAVTAEIIAEPKPKGKSKKKGRR